MASTQFPFPPCGNIAEYYDYDSVFDFLGSGEFATVYKAVRKVTSNNLVSGEEVALKILPKAKVDGPKAAKAIISEVENLRKLKHRHCCLLREVLQSDRDIFIVMALVKDAGELFSVIAGTSLNERAAATVTKQILRAVRYLHVDRRIIHRDLKPENIMISPKKKPTGGSSNMNPEEIKITLVDFGLSKYVGSNTGQGGARGSSRRTMMPRPQIQPSSSLSGGGGVNSWGGGGGGFNNRGPQPPGGMGMPSGSGGPGLSMQSFPSNESMDSIGSHTDSPILSTPVGTLKYSAMETLRGIIENGGDPRETTRGNLQKVDLYSIGIIAHIMLCGQMPFNGRSKPQLATQMESGAKFTAAQWGKVSPEAKDFVQKLLYADPSSRLNAADALKHPWILEKGLKDEDDAKAEQQTAAASSNLPGRPQYFSHNSAMHPQKENPNHNQHQQQQEQPQPQVSSNSSFGNFESPTFDEVVTNRADLNNAFSTMMRAETGEAGLGADEEEDDVPTTRPTHGMPNTGAPSDDASPQPKGGRPTLTFGQQPSPQRSSRPACNLPPRMDLGLGTQNQQPPSNCNSNNNAPHTASGFGSCAASPANPAEDQYHSDATPASGVTGAFGDAGSPTGRITTTTTISSSNSYFGFLSSPSGPRNPPPSMVHPGGEGDVFAVPPQELDAE